MNKKNYLFLALAALTLLFVGRFVLADTTIGQNLSITNGNFSVTSGNISYLPGTSNAMQIMATSTATSAPMSVAASSSTAGNFGLGVFYTESAGGGTGPSHTQGAMIINGTQNGSGSLYGIFMPTLGGNQGPGLEYGLYTGTNWEEAIHTESPVVFTTAQGNGGGDTASTRATISNLDTSLTTNQTLLSLSYSADVSNDSRGKFLEVIENNRTHVVLEKGGNTRWSMSPGSQFVIEPYAPESPLEPTVDILRIRNPNNTALTSTTGVDALSIEYSHGANAANIEGSGIDITLGTSNQSGDSIRGINIQNITSSNEKEYGIVIGSGFDLALQVNSPMALNDSGSMVSLAPNATITASRSYVRVSGSGGAVTGITVAAGVNTPEGSGQILILEGTSDTNTVRFDNTGIMKLGGAANKTLGLNDTLVLIWNGTNWLQIAFNDN